MQLTQSKGLGSNKSLMLEKWEILPLRNKGNNRPKYKSPIL